MPALGGPSVLTLSLGLFSPCCPHTELTCVAIPAGRGCPLDTPACCQLRDEHIFPGKAPYPRQVYWVHLRPRDAQRSPQQHWGHWGALCSLAPWV